VRARRPAGSISGGCEGESMASRVERIVSFLVAGPLPGRLSLCEARAHLAPGELAREPGEVLRDELQSRAAQPARRRLERHERLLRLHAAAARPTVPVSARLVPLALLLLAAHPA